ncbi:uncharacterized protein LOC106534875 isoform X2 [Austrofundulus limnaeus]|uniref:Uncharacterized protein LOC106534875 isoform X2 n=1 Tax=Austrofundulus limnaeus TaxID=52670 RepID=A0A2I4D4D7_AUSLI|nr:PREDICTED: uncharacterized protein LOC106534875 isoform X2 [Austrofundulus limnaeus]
MEGKTRCRMWQIIAAMLLLCSLASCLIYFSLQGRSKVDKLEDAAEALELMKGRIFINENELDYQSDLAATEKDVLTQPDYKAEDDTAEATWRLLNASLECGSDEFTFKAMGPDAADLQLEMDNGKHLPLIHLPKECGFSVKQTVLGLIVIIPYGGCGVKHENGTYNLLMKWGEDDVRIICVVLETPDEIPATSSSSQPTETPSSLLPQSPYRSKRHLRWRPMYVPCFPNKRFPLCLYTHPPQTTTTPEPTFPPLIHPFYMEKLFGLHPIYENYLNMNPQKVMHRMAGKNLGWKLLQTNEKPERPHHPFQYLFERFPLTTTTVPTTTPCTTTTTSSSHKGCLSFWDQLANFHKFNPRGQNHPRLVGEYGTEYQTQDGADSFWDSFPLMPYN